MTDNASLQQDGGKRARAKEVNRQAILEAARRVFARLGFEAATVRDIIRETDLAAGTFYNYFRSKEEVCEALAEDSTARFRPLLAEVRQRAPDFETYIREAYRAYFTFLSREADEAPGQSGTPLALVRVRVDTPEMQAVFDEIRADLERILGGDGLPAVDTEYLAAAAIGIAREMGDYMLCRRPVDVSGATAFASAMLLGGIATAGMTVSR